MDLGYAAFVDAEHAADFFHRQFAGIVEHHNELITLGQCVQGGAQQGT